jgi:hypothetical protein
MQEIVSGVLEGVIRGLGWAILNSKPHSLIAS